MALNNVNVKSGARNRSTSDLSTTTILTTDFFTPRVIYTHEFVPKEKWHARIDSLTRCLPMYKPAYADIKANMRAFFVPLRTLYYKWNSWITNTNDGVDLPETMAYFNVVDFVKAMCYKLPNGTTPFCTSITSLSFNRSDVPSTDSEPIGAPSAYDFCYLWDYEDELHTEKTSINYVILNAKGRAVWSILRGLGYHFATSFSINDSSQVAQIKDKSAVPLIAYLKVYFDYYVNPRDSITYQWFKTTLDQIYKTDSWHLSCKFYDEDVDDNLLYWIFQAIFDVNYSLDYFTSAFENPFSPEQNAIAETQTITDLYNANLAAKQVASSGNVAPVVQQSSASSITTLTQYLDTGLHLLSDVLKRYQLSGMHPSDRYLTQRGVKLRSEYNNKSIYIGHKESPFNIQDITSTGDSALAEYKGKALNYNLNANFEFDSSEFGFIIIISTVVPDVKYFEGEPRYIHHLSRTQFFSEEFEPLGIQGIQASELLADITHFKGSAARANNINEGSIIGYTDRYGEYKANPHAIVAGDFSLGSRNEGYRSWHVLREIEKRVKISEEFRASLDRGQYDRIFEVTDANFDGFIQVFNIDCRPSLPMSSMFESYEFECEDNNTVNIKTGGQFNT